MTNAFVESPFQGLYFRFYHAGALLVLGIVCGIFLTKFTLWVGDVVRGLFKSNKPKTS
eukprot:TRINITY_DN36438_c0_g1_i1.p1 TRINITY_DN36438_c0_g1~~TRINITY_DN36438_c0_g1_i1.p1  ORF type:complete len:58 (+),score=12.12 TRINITY_DN36438_c0_g1_i1:33-206(+)